MMSREEITLIRNSNIEIVRIPMKWKNSALSLKNLKSDPKTMTYHLTNSVSHLRWIKTKENVMVVSSRIDTSLAEIEVTAFGAFVPGPDYWLYREMNNLSNTVELMWLIWFSSTYRIIIELAIWPHYNNMKMHTPLYRSITTNDWFVFFNSIMFCIRMVIATNHGEVTVESLRG